MVGDETQLIKSLLFIEAMFLLDGRAYQGMGGPLRPEFCVSVPIQLAP
jgi:hypothetical protein